MHINPFRETRDPSMQGARICEIVNVRTLLPCTDVLYEKWMDCFFLLLIITFLHTKYAYVSKQSSYESRLD